MKTSIAGVYAYRLLLFRYTLLFIERSDFLAKAYSFELYHTKKICSREGRAHAVMKSKVLHVPECARQFT